MKEYSFVKNAETVFGVEMKGFHPLHFLYQPVTTYAQFIEREEIVG